MNCENVKDATRGQCLSACDFGNYTYDRKYTFAKTKLYCHCDDYDTTICNKDVLGIWLLVVIILGALLACVVFIILIAEFTTWLEKITGDRERKYEQKRKEKKLQKEIRLKENLEVNIPLEYPVPENGTIETIV